MIKNFRSCISLYHPNGQIDIIYRAHVHLTEILYVQEVWTHPFYIVSSYVNWVKTSQASLKRFVQDRDIYYAKYYGKGGGEMASRGKNEIRI